MSAKGDAGILAIMGGRKRPRQEESLYPPRRKPKPKAGLVIEFGASPKKDSSMMNEMDEEMGEGEDEMDMGDDEDREMYVADLEEALKTRDPEALYDAIKAIALSVQAGG